jgi:hypothetical protein
VYIAAVKHKSFTRLHALPCVALQSGYKAGYTAGVKVQVNVGVDLGSSSSSSQQQQQQQTQQQSAASSSSSSVESTQVSRHLLGIASNALLCAAALLALRQQVPLQLHSSSSSSSLFCNVIATQQAIYLLVAVFFKTQLPSHVIARYNRARLSQMQALYSSVLLNCTCVWQYCSYIAIQPLQPFVFLLSRLALNHQSSTHLLLLLLLLLLVLLQAPAVDSLARSAVKGLVWRLFSTTATMGIALLVLHDVLQVSGGLSGISGCWLLAYLTGSCCGCCC